MENTDKKNKPGEPRLPTGNEHIEDIIDDISENDET